MSPIVMKIKAVRFGGTKLKNVKDIKLAVIEMSEGECILEKRINAMNRQSHNFRSSMRDDVPYGIID